MTDEVVVTSGRIVPVGSDNLQVRDDGIPVQFVDLITELRHHNAVVYLSLASSVLEAGNKPLAIMAGRFRMDVGTAQILHKHLGDLIRDALATPDLSKAN